MSKPVFPQIEAEPAKHVPNTLSNDGVVDEWIVQENDPPKLVV